MVLGPKFRNEEGVYLKDAPNYTLPMLGGALANNMLYFDEVNEALKEALGTS